MLLAIDPQPAMMDSTEEMVSEPFDLNDPVESNEKRRSEPLSKPAKKAKPTYLIISESDTDATATDFIYTFSDKEVKY